MKKQQKRRLSDYFTPMVCKNLKQRLGVEYIEDLETVSEREIMLTRGVGKMFLFRLRELQKQTSGRVEVYYTLRKGYETPLRRVEKGTSKTSADWAAEFGITEELFEKLYEGELKEWFRKEVRYLS